MPWPFPILDGEGVQSKNLNAHLRTGFDRVADRVDARAVAEDPGEVALSRPTAVAIHNDGDVRRQPLGINLVGKPPIGITRRERLQQFLHDTKSYRTSSRAADDASKRRIPPEFKKLLPPEYNNNGSAAQESAKWEQLFPGILPFSQNIAQSDYGAGD